MDKNKQLIQDFIEQVWNQREYDKIPNFIDSAYIAHLLKSNRDLKGIEGVQENVKTLHESSPNFKIVVEDMICEGDKVASRITLHGIQGTVRELIIHHINNNRIVEAWSIGSEWS